MAKRISTIRCEAEQVSLFDRAAIPASVEAGDNRNKPAARQSLLLRQFDRDGTDGCLRFAKGRRRHCHSSKQGKRNVSRNRRHNTSNSSSRSCCLFRRRRNHLLGLEPSRRGTSFIITRNRQSNLLRRFFITRKRIPRCRRNRT